MVIRVYVDVNNSGNMFNRRSHTGILIYMNKSLIIWFRKQQNKLESSSFGLELIYLRVATEMVEVLGYKLRTFGIPICGTADVLCDDQ